MNGVSAPPGPSSSQEQVPGGVGPQAGDNDLVLLLKKYINAPLAAKEGKACVAFQDSQMPVSSSAAVSYIPSPVSDKTVLTNSPVSAQPAGIYGSVPWSGLAIVAIGICSSAY